MAWFDEPEKYYRDLATDEPLNQGDIIIAPTSVLFPGTADSDVAGPSDIGQVRRTTLWLPGGDSLPAAPALCAETSWALAMVIPNACAMEKDWNERVNELIAGGVDREEALLQATGDESLDPYVSVAPLVLYDTISPSKHRGIRMNQRLGSFPVCPTAAIPESFVDFNRITTLHYRVAPRNRRVAAVSLLTVSHLQNALAMHFAYRSISGLEEVEAAVGKIIREIAITTRAKGRLVVNFILEDGSTMTLEGEARAGAPQAQPERPSRG